MQGSGFSHFRGLSDVRIARCQVFPWFQTPYIIENGYFTFISDQTVTPSDLTPTRANSNLSPELDIQNCHAVELKMVRINYNGVSAAEGTGTTVLGLCSVCRHVPYTYDIVKEFRKTEICCSGKPNS